jgi:heat shock protein HslJ
MVRMVMMVLIALMMVSCGANAQIPLNNTAWQVVAVNGSGYEDQNAPVLRFGDGTIEGKGLCNSYSAEYQVNGDALTITPIVATEMACEDMILNILERDYFTTLNIVKRYAIVGDELQLFDVNDAVVVLLRKTS